MEKQNFWKSKLAPAKCLNSKRGTHRNLIDSFNISEEYHNKFQYG